jgi:hypothetical protein
MIETICPHCHQSVSFSDFLAGLSVKCHQCRGFVQVPPRLPSGIVRFPETVTDAPAQGAIASQPETVTDAPAQSAITLQPIASAPPDDVHVSDEARRLDIRLRISRWPRLLRWMGIALAIDALVAVAAWFLEGGPTWEALNIVGAFVMVFLTVGGLADWRSRLQEHGLQPGLLFGVLAIWSAGGVWYGVGYFQIPGTIHIENASPQEVEIELNGRPWQSSFPGQRHQVSVRHGLHRIVVRSLKGGELLEEQEVEVGKRRAYILNVLKAETYYEGSIAYGDGSPLFFVTGDGPHRIKEGWIEVTKVDYLFRDPPGSITVKVGKQMPRILIREKRSYLTRGAPPRMEDE